MAFVAALGAYRCSAPPFPRIVWLIFAFWILLILANSNSLGGLLLAVFAFPIMIFLPPAAQILIATGIATTVLLYPLLRSAGFIPVDTSKRDIGSARDAFATLTELLSRFPNSPYSPDARKRLLNLRNQLARSEINIANYYFSRGALVAAANRGQYVVENFQQSPAVADGLAVMAQAYHMLGKQQLADNAVEVLTINYPDYPSLDEQGNFDYTSRMLNTSNSFLDKLTLGLVESAMPPAFDTRMLYNKVAQQDRK